MSEWDFELHRRTHEHLGLATIFNVNKSLSTAR